MSDEWEGRKEMVRCPRCYGKGKLIDNEGFNENPCNMCYGKGNCYRQESRSRDGDFNVRYFSI